MAKKLNVSIERVDKGFILEVKRGFRSKQRMALSTLEELEKEIKKMIEEVFGRVSKLP